MILLLFYAARVRTVLFRPSLTEIGVQNFQQIFFIRKTQKSGDKYENWK